ncbi:MAG: hypothetical protein CVU61_00670 [Deltaproteobacteria bacterium HGW-Deltaproteobacteria-19]|nr:MAG: hypothetical protein CVU61_00670 [Deltaproteobacteria bacterium HGW-Deltaproteobacteria-19]
MLNDGLLLVHFHSRRINDINGQKRSVPTRMILPVMSRPPILMGRIARTGLLIFCSMANTNLT